MVNKNGRKKEGKKRIVAKKAANVVRQKFRPLVSNTQNLWVEWRERPRKVHELIAVVMVAIRVRESWKAPQGWGGRWVIF